MTLAQARVGLVLPTPMRADITDRRNTLTELLHAVGSVGCAAARGGNAALATRAAALILQGVALFEEPGSIFPSCELEDACCILMLAGSNFVDRCRCSGEPRPLRIGLQSDQTPLLGSQSPVPRAPR